ncbi:MAG: site-specific integrase [Methyloceanibacter sp.]
MRKPITPGPRERVLSDDELRKLWRSLPDALARSRACQLIIKLCILTGQRVGEIAGMTRDELDLKARVWNIPGRRSKNGHAHTVPLSGAAIAIIKDAPGDHFLFPDYGGSSLSGHAVARTIRLAQARFGLAQWTAHDLRRTCVTGMAKLGVPPIVIGHAINHRSVTKAGVTLGVYVQHTYASEVRTALCMWADRVAGIVADSARVLPMRKRDRA